MAKTTCFAQLSPCLPYFSYLDDGLLTRVSSVAVLGWRPASVLPEPPFSKGTGAGYVAESAWRVVLADALMN